MEITYAITRFSDRTCPTETAHLCGLHPVMPNERRFVKTLQEAWGRTLVSCRCALKQVTLRSLITAGPGGSPPRRTADLTSLGRPATAGFPHGHFFDRSLVSLAAPARSRNRKEGWGQPSFLFLSADVAQSLSASTPRGSRSSCRQTSSRQPYRTSCLSLPWGAVRYSWSSHYRISP